ncbi:uncharacterized protein LOC143291900 [Babylonia areolata]|uniref:uncharacterized protein LOC143291900 n=1 Tax=Babylonia areolata TaxID=304850 RepID=UPI003FD4379A
MCPSTIVMRCLTPHLLTLTVLLRVWLLWGQAMRETGAAFQLPPFLQNVSEQTLHESQRGEADEGFTTALARRFSPSPKHLQDPRLRKRMRKYWDPFWMSVDRPSNVDWEVMKEAPVNPRLVEVLDGLNFTLRGSDGVDRDIGEDVQHVLRAWLLQRSTCHVRYTWHDLGVLFWPRWVRHGHCQASSGPPSSSSSSSSSSSFHQSSPPLFPSCSWHPGMHCVPAESRRIHLLQWHCWHNKTSGRKRSLRRARKSRRRWTAGRGRRAGRVGRKVGGRKGKNNDTENWNRKSFKGRRRRRRRRKLSTRCKWKKIPYPVTDDCFCSC